MAEDILLTEDKDGVVVLTLNRPGVMNAFNFALLRALAAARRMSLARASSVPPPRAIPLTAAMTGLFKSSMVVNRLRMVKMNALT